MKEKPTYIPAELPQTKTEKVLTTIINKTLNLIIKLYENSNISKWSR
jgi:hypothetical protein